MESLVITACDPWNIPYQRLFFESEICIWKYTSFCRIFHFWYPHILHISHV